MTRLYLLVALLVAISVITGGIVFFSPQYKVARYTAKVERAITEHPAERLVDLLYPRVASRKALERAVAEIWIREGADVAFYQLERTIMHDAMIAIKTSILKASPASVDNFLNVMKDAYDRLLEKEPLSCGAIVGHPPEGGHDDMNMAILSVMTSQEKRVFYNAIAQVILTAQNKPHEPELSLIQAYSFIKQATQDAVINLGLERARKSLTATPERIGDACVLEEEILKNIQAIDDAYRVDVFKIKILRRMAKLKPLLPGANPAPQE